MRASRPALRPEQTLLYTTFLPLTNTEFVFEKRIDSLIVGDLRVSDFAIEVGAMKYGFGG